MDPMLVVSPHLDDAVLSAGESLAGWPGATVMTILAGRPDPAVSTTFDANCGFGSSTTAVVSRWHEDDRALRATRAVAIRTPYRDMQYRDGPTQDEVADAIVRAASAIGAVRLIGPLGLLHPDHFLVSEGFLDAAAVLEVPTWLYEDLPARVEHPESVTPRLTQVQHRGWETYLSIVGGPTVPYGGKRAGIGAYRSQLWALDERVLYVPERLWRLER